MTRPLGQPEGFSISISIAIDGRLARRDSSLFDWKMSNGGYNSLNVFIYTMQGYSERVAELLHQPGRTD